MKFSVEKINKDDEKVRFQLKELTESDIRLKKKLEETEKETKRCLDDLTDI